jgi:hypothetical protein
VTTKTKKPCTALIGAEDKNPCGQPTVGQSELCPACYNEKIEELDEMVESLQDRLTHAKHERYKLQISALG